MPIGIAKIFALAMALGAASAFAAGTDAARPSNVRKVFVVVLENTDYSDALKQPFMARLSREGALLTQYHGVARPSQPNYLALIGGGIFGVSSNDNVDIDERHLGDLLEEKGLTWKAYAEDYPGDCFLGKSKGPYARKHVPFLSFTNVTRNPARCAKIVNAARLEADIAAGELADFTLFIPNNNSNGHDSGVEHADRWLARTFGPLLANPAFMKDMLFMVTFDESGPFGGNRVYAALYGESVIPGRESSQKLTHYDFLRTVEELFSLGSLGRNDKNASMIEGIWR